MLFHVNNVPNIAAIDGLPRASGIPPSIVPAGQIYLQNAGYSFIAESTKTKTTNITYLSFDNAFVILFFFIFGDGIL